MLPAAAGSVTRGRRSCYSRPRVDDIVKDFWNPQCCFPIIKVLFGIKQYIYVGCSKSKKIKVCKEAPAPLKGRVNFYVYGGKASIYDLRSIIENNMEAKQLVHATCSFHTQVERIDYTLGEFTLVYCKLQMLRTNCELFLQSHFLTTHAVRLVPHNFQLDLQYIVLPNETGQCATQYVIQREDKDGPETLTISDTPIAAKQFDFCFEDINEEELLGYLPQGVSGKLLSVTLFRGKRTFTFFVTDEAPTLSLIFQNEFNVSNTLYLTAQTKRKVSFDRSFAVCCGESSAYDDNTEVEYESETSSLSYSFARHLTQALQSHKLYLISPELPVGSSILITVY